MAIVSHRPIQDASHVDFNCTTTAETLILVQRPAATADHLAGKVVKRSSSR